MKSVIRTVLMALVVALTPVLAGAGVNAAHAAVQTRVVFTMSHARALYGATVSVRGQVEGYDTTTSTWRPITPGVGTTYLERRYKGTNTYRTVGTYSGGSSFSFTQKAWKNSFFRVRYAGGTAEVTFEPKTSAARELKVRRKLNDRVLRSGGRFFIRGDVNPGWERRYVTIYRKVGAGGKYKVYKRVLTNAKGQFQVRVYKAKGAPRTYYYAATPATTSFVWSPSTYYYYIYRTAPNLRGVPAQIGTTRS